MEVGDIVKIKENLEVKKLYGNEVFVNSMKPYCGKQAKITHLQGESYCLDVDNGRFAWTDDMLEHKEEIKMKFKVGDYVKIKKGLNHKDTHSFLKAMEEYRGKVAKIVKIAKDYPCYDLDIDGGKWYWTDDMLESAQKKTYNVIVEGNTVTVTDNKGNTGIAKCSPEDEFDLSTGISLAIDRLRWKPSLDEKYYSINFADKNFVTQYNWIDDSTDNTLYERGLIFRTEEEAEEVAKIMLDSIREK